MVPSPPAGVVLSAPHSLVYLDATSIDQDALSLPRCPTRRRTGAGAQPELAKLGLKSYCVSSVSAAQRLLDQWRFDIVLLNTDGFGDRLSSMLAELRNFGLPIVAMTGAPQAEDAQIRALELGATEVVTRSDSTYLIALRLRS